MTSTLTSTSPLVAAARDLFPVLDAAWSQTEDERHLPTPVVEAMRAAGLFRMIVPQELGGEEADLQTFVDVLETVAYGNGAASWDLATSSVGELYMLGLPPKGIERLYAKGPDVIFAGTVTVNRDAAQAVVSEGGYRVSGRWRFGSGCQDADWMVASAQVVESGAPRLLADGSPETRYFVFPRQAVEVLDTWRVLGMRGTGSHDWTVRDGFVAEELTEQTRVVSRMTAHRAWRGRLYRFPLTSITALHFSAVALGLARRAIDSLVGLAGVKTPTRSAALLRERVQVQDAVARAEVSLESARAYRDCVLAEAWRAVVAGDGLTLEQRARLRLAGVNAGESAARAVDLMFGAGGTTSIEDASPLSRSFRDVHVVANSVNLLPLQYELVGRVLLGMELASNSPF